jgi:hypothetical protein
LDAREKVLQIHLQKVGLGAVQPRIRQDRPFIYESMGGTMNRHSRQYMVVDPLLALKKRWVGSINSSYSSPSLGDFEFTVMTFRTVYRRSQITGRAPKESGKVAKLKDHGQATPQHLTNIIQVGLAQ